MSDLLFCPFCGGEAEPFNPFDNADGTWCVLCSECASATGFEQTEAEAIAAWNSRAERTCYADEVTHRDCKYSVNRGWKERTCKNENGYCTKCGALMYDAPNYCPNCGAKVVGE